MEILAPLFRQPFDRLESVAELAVGAVERGSGLDAGLAREVDDREEQVADLVDHRVARARCRGVGIGRPRRRSRGAIRQLGLHLGQLLTHLRRRSGGVRPVEPDRRRALLQAIGLEQRGKRRGDSGQRVPPPLLALDPLPGLGVAQVEQVGVAPTHLLLEARDDVVRGELAPLLRDRQLKRQVQQEIAQLVPDGGDVRLAQRVVQLQHFLDQVRTQGLAGLGPVPGTAPAEIAHHGEGASKR